MAPPALDQADRLKSSNLEGKVGSEDVTKPTSLTVLGCGVLGTAILEGLLANPADAGHSASAGAAKINGAPKINGTANGEPGGMPKANGVPPAARFVACVRTADSAAQLAQTFAGHAAVAVTHGDAANARAVAAADCVLLGCQPGDLAACVGAPAMRRALRGKLLISILAGVTEAQIEATLAPPPATDGTNGVVDGQGVAKETLATVVRTMPNTAAMVRTSATVVAASAATARPAVRRAVGWLFGAIGTVTYIDARLFDACTALCGSGPAFVALFVEALADGAVNLGLKRRDALALAADTLCGTAAMVRAGEHPAEVRDKVATPGGSTIKGLHKLEEGRLRAVVAGALIDCARAATALGGE